MKLELIHMRREPKTEQALCRGNSKYLMLTDNSDIVDCKRCKDRLRAIANRKAKKES